MKLQEQINSLAIQFAKKVLLNNEEIISERNMRETESLRIQSDIVETVVDEYNTIIGG